MTNRLDMARRVRLVAAASLVAVLLVGFGVPAVAAGDPPVAAGEVRPGDAPSQMYLDTVAHERIRFSFAPGGRVDLPLGTAGEDLGVGTAAVDGRREVYGFLPYWELADRTTRLDYGVLTHVAYFSVGVDSAGNLRKRNADGRPTTGWAGWTSSAMTKVINAAHAKGSRVTLTISSFAWTSSQARSQRALLGSATARRRLARQVAATVRDRGADGVNLDFEPLAPGLEDEFVALVRTMRSELDHVRRGAHLSFDTLGYPGNYPLERSLARGGADAVLVMGYDYRTAGSKNAGSIDPLAGPAYDLAETVRAYTARVAPSRVILGVPYYGRAWSTVSDAPNARTRSAATYGASAAVPYEIAVRYAAEHGRRYDAREVSAWTAYRWRTCSSDHGCVTTWRELYYDDAATLKARYDLVNRAGLRGAGIWALGYDGARTELSAALAEKFLRDATPPRAGIVAFAPGSRRDEGFLVRWTGRDDRSGVAAYDVDVSVDGGRWSAWLRGTTATSATYLGADGRGYAFRVRARDRQGNLSAWHPSGSGTGAARLVKGGFLRTTASRLAVRSRPDTSASRVTIVARGSLFAITSGPRKADGYTWYRVTGPLTTWAPVGAVRTGAWIATSGQGATNAAAVRAPNVAVVRAGIRQVGFAGRGSASLGTGAGAVQARSFSPDGDGSEDTLKISWNNRIAFDRFAIRILRPDGTLVGTRALRTTRAGRHSFAWDGRRGRTALPDGSYVLQLVGRSQARDYRWPAASPTPAGIREQVVVRIDRTPPRLVTASMRGAKIAPAGDARYAAARIAGKGSADAVRWEVVFARRSGSAYGSPVRRLTGSGRTASVSWNGTTDRGARAPGGTYRATLRFLDAAGNAATRSWTLVLDRTPPLLALAASTSRFSPDGDGSADTVRLRWSIQGASTGTLRVLRGSAVVRSWKVSGTSGTVTWNGRDRAGRPVADARYTVTLTASDALGNRARTSATITADRTISRLRWSPSAFFPQDGDRLASGATLTARVTAPARVTLRIRDAAGRVVRTAFAGRRVAAGTVRWRWDGRTSTGAWAPQGRYVAELTAVGSLGTTVLRRAVVADAWQATPSSSTPRAGTHFSVTFRAVEPGGGRPAAWFRQRGRRAVPMTVVRLSDGSWRASITVAAGAAGPAAVILRGRDVAGGLNRSTVGVTVR